MKFEIISLLDKEIKSDISQISLLTESGKIIILNGHEPILGEVLPGEIVIEDKANIKTIYHIKNGGTYRVFDNSTAIVVEDFTVIC